MSDSNDPFREQLLGAQSRSPQMYDSYQKQLNTMLHPPMTFRSAAPGAVLLIALVACIIGIIRAMIIGHVGLLMNVGYAVLAIAFIGAAGLIVRDLRRRTHSHRSVNSIAGMLTGAAGTLTVISLLLGLGHASDPKALFGAFYVFVFYFACAIWAIEGRIKSAELAGREQGLRIEYRLAELSERLGK